MSETCEGNPNNLPESNNKLGDIGVSLENLKKSNNDLLDKFTYLYKYGKIKITDIEYKQKCDYLNEILQKIENISGKVNPINENIGKDTKSELQKLKTEISNNEILDIKGKLQKEEENIDKYVKLQEEQEKREFYKDMESKGIKEEIFYLIENKYNDLVVPDFWNLPKNKIKILVDFIKKPDFQKSPEIVIEELIKKGINYKDIDILFSTLYTKGKTEEENIYYTNIFLLNRIKNQKDPKEIKNLLILNDEITTNSIPILKKVYEKINNKNPGLINIFKKEEKNAEMFDKLLKGEKINKTNFYLKSTLITLLNLLEDENKIQQLNLVLQNLESGGDKQKALKIYEENFQKDPKYNNVHIYFDKIDTLLLDNIQEELNEIKIIFNIDDFIMSMAGLNFQLNHIPKNELKKLIDYLKMININKLNPNKAIEDLTKQGVNYLYIRNFFYHIRGITNNNTFIDICYDISILAFDKIKVSQNNLKTLKDLEKEKEEQKEKENKLIDDIILLIDYKNNVPYIKDINGFKQSLIDYYGKEEFDKKFKDKKPSEILDILKEDLEKSTKEVTPELKKIGFDDQKLQNLKDEKIKQEILEELEKQDSTKFFKLLKDNGIIKEIPEDERLKDEIKNKIKLGLVIKKLEDTSKIYQNEKFSNLFQSAWEGNIDNNTYLKSIKTEIDKQAGIQNQNDTKLSQSTVGSNYQGLSTLTPENPIAKLEIGKGIFAKVEKINDTNYLIKGIGNEPIKCNNLEQVDKVLDIGDYLNKLGLGFMIPHINRITNEIEKKQKHDGEKFDLTDGFGDKEKILFLKIVGNIIFDTKNSYFNENKTIDYKLPDFKNVQTLEDIERIFLNCGQGLGGLKKVKEIIEDQGYVQFGLFNIIPFLEAIK